METKVIKFKVNNFKELFEAIMDDIFSEQLASCKVKTENKQTSINDSPISNPHHICIERIADRMNWKPEKVANFLSNLWEINPSAAFSVLLREIAIELDKKYKDHINNCKELFVVSLLDGRIHKIPRAQIKNFKNFAAFRTIEDAKIACNILREDLKELFKSCGK